MRLVYEKSRAQGCRAVGGRSSSSVDLGLMRKV